MAENTNIPTISAVIVTYQSDLNKLKRAVDSLRLCSYPIAITIIDNHSGGTYTGDLARSFPDIKVVDSGMNKGFGAGHNLGFAMQPPSDYHLVVNPDIRVAEGNIEAMINFMQKNPDIGLCTPKIVNERGELQYLCKRNPSIMALFGRRFMPKKLAAWLLKGVMQRYEMRDKDYNKIFEPDFLSGCFMCFRGEVFKQVDSFDERFFLYFEDADITRRVKQVSRAVHFPGAEVTHHWAGGARNSRKLTRIMLISAIKYFNKWGWRWW